MDKEKYKIATIVNSQSQKKERLIFTTRDHQILAKSISISKESPRGNKLYIDLEKAYPHHTWQSWKDYALKKYLPYIKPREALHEEQENANVENQETDFVQKDPEYTPDNVHLNSDQDLKRIKLMSIPESDQLNINQYLDDFNRLCEEFDFWERHEILTALFMASGSVKIARSILSVGFNLKDLDKDVEALIYTREQDKMILEGSSIIYKELLIAKGERSVSERKDFLSKKPNCGVDCE